MSDENFTCMIKENDVFICMMYLIAFIFMVKSYFTQTYEDEHKHLNFEKHKEEFEMQSLTVMDLSRIET